MNRICESTGHPLHLSNPVSPVDSFPDGALIKSAFVKTAKRGDARSAFTLRASV
jgi:hypothetical protein